jgi:branched-subunit amino acid transport protein
MTVSPERFFIYLLIMAGITYLLRLLPMLLIRRKIENKFIRSFLYYIPYAVLAVMAIPAMFHATSYLASGIIGAAVAIILAYLFKNLIIVASGSCVAVLIAELIIPLFI